MQLRMTVTGWPGPGAATEVEVEAGRGATVADLRLALTDLLGAAPATRLAIGGRPVDDSALVGHPPLLDGVSLSLTDRACSAPSVPRSAVVLAVVGGADAGRSFELPPGRHTLGRSPAADLTIADPGLSRLHAALDVGPDGIRVTDPGSTNGTHRDGTPVGVEGVDVRGGDVLILGESRLRLRPAASSPAATVATGDGTRAVNRRPRVLQEEPAVAIALPAPPERPQPARVPWLAMLLPLPVSAALAFFLGPMMLAFALVSPLMMVGNAVGDRLGGRRAYAARLREHQARLASAQALVDAAVAEEVRHRRRALPDPAEVQAIVAGPSSRVWERRRGDRDFLSLNAGFCTTSAATRVIHPPGQDGPERPTITDVPCALPLDRVGVLGISGPRDRALGAARSLVGQVAALHSPHDVELWLCTDGSEHPADWGWLTRLPHARQGAGHARHRRIAAGPAGRERTQLVEHLQELVDTRRQQTGAWTGPRVVLVVDGAQALRSLPGLARAMAAGPPVGVLFVAISSTAEGLPAECGSSLELSERGGWLRLPGSSHTDLAVDQVAPWWADRLSRALAPLRDAAPPEVDGEIPSATTLLELLPVDATDAAAIARRWSTTPARTRVVVGRGPREPHHLDLAVDGPHVLVGGTTGSGKSEFLQTLVTSLALANHPDQLSFVLIDYKGGAAFRECARFPHTVGLVTDLDGHLADRALVSLRAELKRRERLLAQAGVTDHQSYAASDSGVEAPLPRLVIVIDEFRALAEEIPPFVDGLVRVAGLGRSLGVHLVLATQRPAGVVTGDIKSNVNLRVALRVRDRSDSEDVIDAPDAASLGEDTPGRAFARSGGTELAGFQVASVSARTTDSDEAPVRVREVDWAGAPLSTPGDRQSRHRGPTDLQRIADAMSGAAELIGNTPGEPAWLEPLPSLVRADSLTHPDRWLVPLGLADRPAEQSQDPVYWDLRQPGHWGFVGAGATGRSTALRGIAAHVAGRFAPTEVHLYAIAAGSLDALAQLPHAGAVVATTDVARVERLVSRLGAEVHSRRAEIAAQDHASLAEWLVREPGTAPPPMVLLVDDWDQLTGALDAVDHGALTERLHALLRDGGPAGLRAAVAGGRGLVGWRTSSLLQHRAALRPADRADAPLLGLPVGAFPEHQPPGRALLTDGTELQLAVHGDGGTAAFTARVAAAAAQVAEHTGMPGARLPLRVEPLPVVVRRDELAPGRPGKLVFAVGGDELGAVGLDPRRDGRQILVAGTPRSGKSTALATLAEALVSAGWPTAVVTDRPGPWDALHGAVTAWCDPDHPSELIAARRRQPGLAVLVDDADRVLDTPVEAVLLELAQLVDRDDGLLVCAASSQAVAAQFRGVAAEVARRRTGLLLGPRGAGDGDVFGLRVRPDHGAPAGRGLWVTAGAVTVVQVAAPDRRGGGLTDQLAHAAR